MEQCSSKTAERERGSGRREEGKRGIGEKRREEGKGRWSGERKTVNGIGENIMR